MKSLFKPSGLRNFATKIIQPKESVDVKVALWTENKLEIDPYLKRCEVIALKTNGKLDALSFTPDIYSSPEVALKDLRDRKYHSVDVTNKVPELVKKVEDDVLTQFLSFLNPTARDFLKIDARNIDNILKYNLAIPSGLEPSQEVSYNRCVRNRAKLVHFFPIVSSIVHDDHIRGSKILDSVNAGVGSKPSQIIKDIFKAPLMDMAFARRVAGANQLYLAQELYRYLFDGLPDLQTKSSQKIYQTRISNILLPSHEHYAEMWKCVKCFQGMSLPQNVKAQMFNKIDGQFLENAETLGNKFYDDLSGYLNSISLHLLLPDCVEKFNSRVEELKSASGANAAMTGFPDLYGQELVREVLEELSEVLKQKIVAKYSPQQMSKFFRENEARAAEIDKSRPLFVKRKEEFELSNYASYPQWYKAFEDLEISGVRFKCLVNENELTCEGREIGHCSSGYANRCLEGNRHIISAEVVETGERFTLRLDKNISDKKLLIAEVVTKKDASQTICNLSNQAAEAVKVFEKKLEKDEIRISQKLGSVNDKLKLSEVIGCDIYDEESRKKLFAAYRKAEAIPGNSESFEEFKKEFGLEEEISKMVEQKLSYPSQVMKSYVFEKLEHKGPREFGIRGGE